MSSNAVAIRLSRWARLPETLLLTAVLVGMVWLLAGRQDGLSRLATGFFALAIAVAILRLGFMAWGDRTVVLIDETGVSWRRAPILERYRFLAWSDIRMVRLEQVLTGKNHETGISLIRPGGERGGLILVADLEPDPETLLDAFRPYGFVQDMR